LAFEIANADKVGAVLDYRLEPGVCGRGEQASLALLRQPLARHVAGDLRSADFAGFAAVASQQHSVVRDADPLRTPAPMRRSPQLPPMIPRFVVEFSDRPSEFRYGKAPRLG
jgi:hypothetical protein